MHSAGFDACEHEHQMMQRHDRRVPTSFFSRYTRDIVKFANQFAEGKVVSVLEGGYSDRALTSAAIGHVIGLLDRPGDASWWTELELMNVSRRRNTSTRGYTYRARYTSRSKKRQRRNERGPSLLSPKTCHTSLTSCGPMPYWVISKISPQSLNHPSPQTTHHNRLAGPYGRGAKSPMGILNKSSPRPHLRGELADVEA